MKLLVLGFSGLINMCYALFIANPERNLYRHYAVESSWSGYLKGLFRLSAIISATVKGYSPCKMGGKKSMIPADFLIGSDFTAQVAYYGKDIGDHLPVQKLMNGWIIHDNPVCPSVRPRTY